MSESSDRKRHCQQLLMEIYLKNTGSFNQMKTGSMALKPFKRHFIALYFQPLEAFKWFSLQACMFSPYLFESLLVSSHSPKPGSSSWWRL